MFNFYYDKKPKIFDYILLTIIVEVIIAAVVGFIAGIAYLIFGKTPGEDTIGLLLAPPMLTFVFYIAHLSVYVKSLVKSKKGRKRIPSNLEDD